MRVDSQGVRFSLHVFGVHYPIKEKLVSESIALQLAAMKRTYSLCYDEILEVFFNNHVSHTFHSLLQEICIRGSGVMHIHVSGRLSQATLELLREELLGCEYIIVFVWILWEPLADRRHTRAELLLKQINLVKK